MEAIVKGLIEGDGSTQRIMVVSGLGGSGKTQLSLKFARDFRDRYVEMAYILRHSHRLPAIDTFSSWTQAQWKMYERG